MFDGLVGAVIGALVVIIYQFFTDKTETRRKIALETIAYIQEIEKLLYRVRNYKHETYANQVMTIHEEEDRTNRHLFWEKVTDQIHPTKLKLEFRSGEIQKSYSRVVGVLTSAMRLIPVNSPDATWPQVDMNFNDYIGQMVTPARTDLNNRLIEACSIQDIAYEYFTKIIGPFKGPAI